MAFEIKTPQVFIWYVQLPCGARIQRGKGNWPIGSKWLEKIEIFIEECRMLCIFMIGNNNNDEKKTHMRIILYLFWLGWNDLTGADNVSIWDSQEDLPIQYSAGAPCKTTALNYLCMKVLWSTKHDSLNLGQNEFKIVDVQNWRKA